MTNTHRCTHCNKDKRATEFPKHDSGLGSWCRDCLNKYKREKRAADAAAQGRLFKPRPKRSFAATSLTQDDKLRLHQLVNEGRPDKEIAEILGRTPGAVAAMKIREKLSLTSDAISANIRAGLRQKGIGPTEEDDAVISQDRPTKTIVEIHTRLPHRKSSWIQRRARELGVRASSELRREIGRRAQSRVDHDKRLKLDVSMKFVDLAYLEQKVFGGGIMGDGGVYRSGHGRYYHYAESHAGKLSPSDQADYVDWIYYHFLRPELRNHIGNIHGGLKRQMSTASHPAFSCLRDFYDDTAGYDPNSGERCHNFKCKIPDWFIEIFDEIDIFFWYMGDGSACMEGGRPYPMISAPRWRRADLERMCEVANSRLGLRLYIWPRGGEEAGVENRLQIPAEDVGKLWPIWRRFASDHDMPECMWYKIPEYIPSNVGGPRGGKRWEDMIVVVLNGAKQLVSDPIKVKLIHDIIEMKKNGATRAEMSAYLKSQGYPLSKEAITRLFKRFASGRN